MGGCWSISIEPTIARITRPGTILPSSAVKYVLPFILRPVRRFQPGSRAENFQFKLQTVGEQSPYPCRDRLLVEIAVAGENIDPFRPEIRPPPGRWPTPPLRKPSTEAVVAEEEYPGAPWRPPPEVIIRVSLRTIKPSVPPSPHGDGASFIVLASISIRPPLGITAFKKIVFRPGPQCKVL